MLYLYIDGLLADSTATDAAVVLSGTNKWTLGRNEKFPDERDLSWTDEQSASI